MCKYPDIEIDLSATDGNAYHMLSNCRRQARRAGLSKDDINSFLEEAKSDDYDHLIRTIGKWFTIDVNAI